MAAPFGAEPEFVDGVATLNAYLNFGKASEEGTLEIVSKVRGAEKAVTELYSKMKENGYCGGNRTWF